MGHWLSCVGFGRSGNSNSSSSTIQDINTNASLPPGRWESEDGYSFCQQFSLAIDETPIGQSSAYTYQQQTYTITKFTNTSGALINTHTQFQQIIRRVIDNPPPKNIGQPQPPETLSEDFVWEVKRENVWKPLESHIAHQIEDLEPGHMIQTQINLYEYNISKSTHLIANLTNLKTQDIEMARRRAVLSPEFSDDSLWEVICDGGISYLYPPLVCKQINRLKIGDSIPYETGGSVYEIVRTGKTMMTQVNTKTNQQRSIRRVVNSDCTWEIDLFVEEGKPDWSLLSPTFCCRLDSIGIGEEFSFDRRRNERCRLTKTSHTTGEQMNCRTGTVRRLRRRGDPLFSEQEAKIQDEDVELTEEQFVVKEFEKYMSMSSWKIVAIEAARMNAARRTYEEIRRGIEEVLGRKDIERRLWHGTSRRIVDHILNQGFLRDHNKRHVYGHGVYFGVNASVSHQYTQADVDGNRVMLFSKVIVGDMIVGKEMYDRPPTKRDGVTEYECMVDNVKQPRIFVISKDYHAVPEYIVTYRRR